MGRSYGLVCGCGHRYSIVDGDIMNAVQLRCDQCGRSHFEQRESLRKHSHEGAHRRAILPERHHRERDEIGGRMVEIELRRAGGLRGVLDAWAYRRLAARRAALDAEAQAALAANPMPPLPEPDRSCACGGTLRQDAPIRCPACRSTAFERDPTVPEMRVD